MSRYTKRKYSKAEYEEMYMHELEELNMPYTDEEIELHLYHREWKSILEMIHAHNWQLILLCLSWLDYLDGKGKRPVKKICKYVNPSQSGDINNACYFINRLIELMVEYGEGKCPKARITTYCSRSTATLIDKLGLLKHSKHLTRAECAAGKIFKFATYHGEPTMSPQEYAETLNKLAETFVAECTANAEELADFTAELVEEIEGNNAASIYRRNNRPITTKDALNLLKQKGAELKTALTNDGNATRATIKRAKSELVSVVIAATTEGNECCHHPNKQKDKLVQEVIKYLARPGVTFSINNACCQVAGKKKTGKCKEPWLYDWAHRHEKQIQDAAEIIKNGLL